MERCRLCIRERQFMGNTLFKLPPTTHTVQWVDSIPDSTWEEKEAENSRRRSKWVNSAGKEVGIEDKSQVEKRCHLVLMRGRP
ncbi:hypothetical protein PoB_005949900 [Plakobranchus ocellatus]|uniref:Uncharacterized protein n=1 Tax=Plakobranchus ocellatus TaxID=259542 RepID=A0AAV4CN38_9GAST|nr:hypothetical protein PoB_005949900 [Plakobranchus ocellatus]